MRVQHNITAMNSYRNFTTNNSALGKNLEKLSSGYAINRAGDNAAGLAISEKMRAQITGLDVAQKNANDGISLVQTAEGALTEVHSMLNRMYELAEQSANGTYESSVDRAQLQKEVDALKDEINRIADSANFNGIQLLDGSLESAGGSAVLGGTLQGVGSPSTAAKEKDTVASGLTGITAGSKYTVEITFKDGGDNVINKTYEFTATSTTTVIDSANGKTYTVTNDAHGITSAVKQASENANDALTSTFTIDDEASTFEANSTGDNKGQILSFNIAKDGVDIGASSVTRTVKGADVYNTVAVGSTAAYAGAAGTKASDFVFTVNGEKFAYALAGKSGAFDSDVNVVIAAAAAPVAAEVSEMVSTINRVVGADVASVNATTATSIDFKTGDTTKGGLRLQIGDTSQSFNQMNVSVADMHTTSLGISGIDISSQDGAAAALDSIKAAINSVSDTRGGLGAIQNRLEHTINNLSVMQENLQNAESVIRDTDVADEMMEYTKNSILNQSAQAMLAQANQLPQGVLQLLQ